VQERTAELRESEARYRSLTELASDWYWEQDENMNFTKVSGPVLEMLGIRVDAGGGIRRRPGTGLERGGAEQLQATIAARSRSWISCSAASMPMARNNSFGSAASRCSPRPAASSAIAASAWKSPARNSPQ
jgi:hypothetical protein